MANTLRKKTVKAHEVELVPIEKTKPHPRNYREHSDEQIEHLCQSILEHDVYKNAVIARDGTVLAGHGVRLALLRLGRAHIPAVRLPLRADSPQALKILAADNEIAKLAKDDEEALFDILSQIHEATPAGLLGTGYDEDSIAALVAALKDAQPSADTPFASFPDAKLTDDFVSFKLGDYAGKVSKAVYESFAERFRKLQQDTAEPMLDVVLRGWLIV